MKCEFHEKECKFCLEHNIEKQKAVEQEEKEFKGLCGGY
jgi:hypothetical protein